MSEPLTAAGAAKCPHRWQPSKTDAEGTCYEYACWRCGGIKRTLYGDALARAEAAARAVDEALSVGEVVRMLEGIRRAIEVMGEDGECSLRTIRGVQYVTKDDAMLAVDDYLGVMRFRAAALVAHLRGPR